MCTITFSSSAASASSFFFCPKKSNKPMASPHYVIQVNHSNPLRPISSMPSLLSVPEDVHSEPECTKGWHTPSYRPWRQSPQRRQQTKSEPATKGIELLRWTRETCV